MCGENGRWMALHVGESRSPYRCSCWRSKRGGSSTDRFIVRKGRKGRKESKGRLAGVASIGDRLFLPSFAFFASFADKAFY
jgi:hypothetical protein